MNAITSPQTSRIPAPTLNTSGSALTQPEPSRDGSPATRTQTGFDPTPVATVAPTRYAAPSAPTASVSGGGELSDALTNGVARIAAWAHRGMAGIQQAIQGDMNANNGQVDPARMQQYTMQMSNFELMNQMAAKMQEKEEAAIKVWLR
ncbi:MAG: hypothetical protein JWM86_61 [Thermoleophilia bacterium]|nr:hypothetical protein [Thermoleophilia bacterium]